MDFQLLAEITEIEPIAIGPGIRDLPRLVKTYGEGR